MFEVIFLKHTIYVAWLKRLFRCSFSHMTFLMSCVIYLNNTHELSYKSSCNELEKIAPNIFETKLVFFQRA